MGRKKYIGRIPARKSLTFPGGYNVTSYTCVLRTLRHWPSGSVNRISPSQYVFFKEYIRYLSLNILRTNQNNIKVCRSFSNII